MKKAYSSSLSNIARIALIGAFFFLGVAAGGRDAHAQASMSGGGYTLNGGLTVFSAELSGGGYSLGTNGDPIGVQASGGGYVMTPTPFGELTGNTYTVPGNSPSVSGFSAGPTGAGYTVLAAPGSAALPPLLYPQNDPMYGQENPTGRVGLPDESRPVFDSGVSPTGVEWIDRGSGIDADLDGVPDASVDPQAIRRYHNDMTPLKVVLASLFVLCALFARVIRVAPGSPGSFCTKPVSIGVLQTFRVSRIPAAILIDAIIVLHGAGDRAGRDIPVRAPRIEKNAHLAPPGSHQAPASSFILMDSVIVPALTVACIAWAWPASWILGMSFVCAFFARLFLGKKILRDESSI